MPFQVLEQDAQLRELLDLLNSIGISLPGDVTRETFQRDLFVAVKTRKRQLEIAYEERMERKAEVEYRGILGR